MTRYNARNRIAMGSPRQRAERVSDTDADPLNLIWVMPA